MASPGESSHAGEVAKYPVCVQQIIEAAGISWAEAKRIPKELLDFINETLKGIEKHKECVVDSELNAKDVLIDLVRLSLQNYLFCDRIGNLQKYVKRYNKREIKSDETQLNEFIETLVHHIDKALKKFRQVEDEYEKSRTTARALAKTCAMGSEKASNDRFKHRLVAVAVVSIIAIGGIFILPAFLPAATATATTATISTGAGTISASTVTVAAGASATGVKVGAAAASLVAAGCYIPFEWKYTKIINSFETLRQLTDEVISRRDDMYTYSMCIKTRLEAIQGAIEDFEFHKTKNHSSKAINGSIDTLFEKLDDLCNQVQPVGIPKIKND